MLCVNAVRTMFKVQVLNQDVLNQGISSRATTDKVILTDGNRNIAHFYLDTHRSYVVYSRTPNCCHYSLRCDRIYAFAYGG